MVIDTSGKFHNNEEANTDILLMKQELIIKDSDELRIYKIPKSLKVDLKPEQIEERVGDMLHLSWMILFPIIIVLVFIYRLIQAVLYAVMGKVFSLLADNPIRYVHILKLSLVAVTPAIIIKAFLLWFDFTFPFQWLCFFGLTMGYLIFAIQVNRY